jgi:hypothetical protein
LFDISASETLAEAALARVDKMTAARCQAVQPGAVCQKIDREVAMRLAFSGIAVLAFVFVPFTLAKAETCSGRAQICVVKWGGPRAACFDSFRLAACEKTGRYVAPNGNVWPASREPKDLR